MNAVIVGDTRVDFFLHGAADRATDANRRLAFFVCFNMAFYEVRRSGLPCSRNSHCLLVVDNACFRIIQEEFQFMRSDCDASA